MPVIPPVERLDDWLTVEPVEAAAFIGPAPQGALVATAVGKHVNSVSNDDVACVAPAEHEAPSAQRSLF
jgi:putative SOS response-associated peptidase YedK